MLYITKVEKHQEIITNHNGTRMEKIGTDYKQQN